jgi:hypothetical protein
MNKKVYYHITPLTVQILIVKQRCGENAHETTSDQNTEFNEK